MDFVCSWGTSHFTRDNFTRRRVGPSFIIVEVFAKLRYYSRIFVDRFMDSLCIMVSGYLKVMFVEFGNFGIFGSSFMWSFKFSFYRFI
jgi:hypothetical protein